VARRRCRNCPEEQPAASVVKTVAASAAVKVTGAVIDQKIITADGAGQKLWNHVLFGTSTCVGMMRGYAELGMPGDPLPQLRDIISMLTELKTQLEKQHADRNPTERLPDHSDQGADAQRRD